MIVGAGPAGLASAIRLKQAAAARDQDLNVCVVEKGAEVGSHILSGNVFDPRALTELIPDWAEKGAPLEQKVESDKFFFLTESSAIPLPIPPQLHNDGNYIISLGNLCRWLGEQAEELGVEIYPGFSASEVLYEDGKVVGIATSDMGLDKEGKPKDTYARGMELRGKQTLLGEGCRGSLSEDIMKQFNLRADCDEQTYGIGLKEVWEVDNENFKPGTVIHSAGWPLDNSVYGGSFMYHMAPNKILLGYVVGLDYENPYLSPYDEFQRFKHHPNVSKYLKGGRCVQYGARALNEGGYQALPKLTFPGGALIGCSAGFMNVPKIKGSHYAMKSGMVAADTIASELLGAEGGAEAAPNGIEVTAYEEELKKTWVYSDLHEVRNVHPSYRKTGSMIGCILYSGVDTLLLRGKAPWTFHCSGNDASRTKPASECKEIIYPKPDGVLSFDLLTNLQRSGTFHEDDQLSHLQVKEDLKHIPESVSYQKYAAPESRFCPAKVYEYVTDEDGKNPKLVINSQNCLHCKTCSIKSPEEFIRWNVPEGGGGPNYEAM